LLQLLLNAAEKQIEQAFGGCHLRRKRNGTRERNRGNRHHAAPHAQKGQLGTQRLLHPTQQNPLRRARPQPDSP
jgi:hypothetical protein